jgi:hypothetical protein
MMVVDSLRAVARRRLSAEPEKAIAPGLASAEGPALSEAEGAAE